MLKTDDDDSGDDGDAMEYTKTAKCKRASFIEINKERARSAPSRVKREDPMPSYMNKTSSAKSKRKSFLFGSSDVFRTGFKIDWLDPRFKFSKIQI